ncbi:dipeptide/oligopeptide/nickel ABC transporter permease/ATP-binding protein [Microlunatus spumicola]|uniref:Dipeptide/oligopeptide/nickel ABC transporter permease/ATP-binding protein n=1 Tax=Microlunatus spumicola TaxID=81499 RepID=A0ABP6YCU1_9ACTN
MSTTLTDLAAAAAGPAVRRRRRPRVPGGVALGLLALFVLLSIFGPWIWGGAAGATNIPDANQSSSAEHWLGTDDLGRDLLARTLYATRSSLVLAVLATVVGGIVGVALGLLSGVSQRLGRVLGAVINLLMAFPALLLSIFFAVLFGIGSVGSVLAVGAAFAPGFARITQTLTASAVSRDYVEASKVLGKSPLYVVLRHILPNIAEPVILYTTIHIGTAILALSGLSFLGLGVQPPAYDWGRLLSDGLTRVYISPLAAIGPSVAIVLAGLTFNLAGEHLSDLVGGRRSAPGTVTDPVPVAAGPAVGAPRDAVVPGDDTPARSSAPAVPVVAPLLEVRGLRVLYPGADGGTVTPVRDVSFSLAPGETVGIVGESGSGKSMATSAIAQLVEAPGSVRAEVLTFDGIDLAERSRANESVLGRSMAMIFQDPGEALNPAIKIGTHLIEPAVVHLHQSKPVARGRAVEALRAVAINDPERRYDQHQHELSGGMKQRACIAVGLMGEPKLLIADEPTTALDVTVQRQILRLIADVRAESGASVLFISHDIAVVAEISDRILVMYAGFVVEEATADELLARPAHPYTSLLLAASPDMGVDRSAPLPMLDGRMPGPDVDLPGCYFAARCPRADQTCVDRRPPLLQIGAPAHRAACWHPLAGTAPTPTEEVAR